MLTKTADALPGFGIVAAVLGIVITMGSIDGPVEQIGEKVGAALVGTFLGILLSYGFFSPLAVRMEFLGEAEMRLLPGGVGDRRRVRRRHCPEDRHRECIAGRWEPTSA